MKHLHLTTQKIQKMVGHKNDTPRYRCLPFPAQEIENLRQESQALNSIRQSMGSDDFPRKVFEKVFKDDINRLRSMDDMWKTRKRPNALDFDQLSKSAEPSDALVAQLDQKVWTEAENFIVFRDRYSGKHIIQRQRLTR